MEIAMFPGQGSQYIGMGDKLFRKYSEYTDLASEILGYSILDVCEGCSSFGLESLNQTFYAQPAIFVLSCLTFIDYQSNAKSSSNIDICIGHSLGLFSSLFAAGIFTFEQGLEIVKTRASLMQKASEGGMAAIIGEGVRDLYSLLISNEFFDIDIANYNGPKQVVISGPVESIVNVQTFIESQGMRYIRLNVSGAFHSKLMEPARIQFVNYLTNVEFNEPNLKVISTTNGEEISSKFMIEELSYQLVRPVRWYQTVLSLYKKYSNVTFVELGPGSVLTSLNNYIL